MVLVLDDACVFVQTLWEEFQMAWSWSPIPGQRHTFIQTQLVLIFFPFRISPKLSKKK